MEEKKKYQPSVNPNSDKFKQRIKKSLSVSELLEGILSGNRVILGQAITLIESKSPTDNFKARALIEACLPYSGNALRVGITGTPGVGKSTFVEGLGNHILQQNNTLAVLAIDPSSHKSRGSILGDKTRMNNLSANPNAFIRPSPAGEALGGVAQQSRETVILCEAAGFEIILIETVGVGQSEIAVHSMSDFFLLLLLPGAGDELQGIKRGIVEMADLIAVNKADGERIELAKNAKREYRNALHLFPPQESGWIPKVKTCSALEQTGIDEIWQTILEYQKQTTANGFFAEKRKRQATYWLEETMQSQWRQSFLDDPGLRKAWDKARKEVSENRWSPFKGASYLLELYSQKLKQ